MGPVATHPEPADDASADPVGGVREGTDVPARPLGRLDSSRCSVQARLRGDSPVATASPVQRWLLIEQPGPWGIDALTESRFDADVAPKLAKRSREEGVRLLLVRRPGGRLADSGRRWAYGDSRAGHEGLWWSVRATDADLLTAPWDGSVGESSSRPTYLVCTHGGHDACCALRGRPRSAQQASCPPWVHTRYVGLDAASPTEPSQGAVSRSASELLTDHHRPSWPARLSP